MTQYPDAGSAALPSLLQPFAGVQAPLMLQAAVRAARMGLWEWNPATGQAAWSPEIYDLLRLPRGDGVESGARFISMIHEDDIAAVDAALGQAQARGGVEPMIFRVNAGDGSVRWLMSCGQLAQLPGQHEPRLFGVNIDVTDTVESEQRLRAASVGRERREAVIQAVLEHAPIGIAVSLAGEEQLAYVSDFGLRMLKKDDANGHAWDVWQIYHPVTRAPIAKEAMALHRAANGEVIHNEEWLIRAYDGSLLPVSCNAGPIRTADGSILGATVAWYDITPFKEAQRQRELFMAAVSHELRTPLSAVLGWTEALLRNPDPAKLERGLQAIKRNVQAQARLVDDLLDVSRFSVGKLQLKLEPADMHRIALAALETVSPTAEAAQVTLSFEPSALGVVIVLADELRLRQAIWNLMTNAVKFSRPGGLVALRLEVKDGFAELAVTDHGTGIDKDSLASVFDEFWQARRDDHRLQGLGLGLTITRHIVVGHGGTVTASSPGLGLGATFTIRLPLATIT